MIDQRQKCCADQGKNPDLTGRSDSRRTGGGGVDRLRMSSPDELKSMTDELLDTRVGLDAEEAEVIASPASSAAAGVSRVPNRLRQEAIDRRGIQSVRRCDVNRSKSLDSRR